jgi:hypothetical protein
VDVVGVPVAACRQHLPKTARKGFVPTTTWHQPTHIILLPLVILSSQSHLSFRNIFPSTLPGKTIYIPVFSARARYHAFHVFLHFNAIIIIILMIITYDEYKLRRSSLLNFLHPRVTSTTLDPNILLGTLLFKTSIPSLPSGRMAKFHSHMRHAVLCFYALQPFYL